MRAGGSVARATRTPAALSQETCPGATDPSPRETGAPSRAVRGPGAHASQRRGPFDSGAKDAMIGTLLSLFLRVAPPAASSLCVRGDAASLPDSGAAAVQS